MNRFEIAAQLNTHIQKQAQDNSWTEQIGDWALDNFVSEDKKQEWMGRAVKEAAPYLISSLTGAAAGAGLGGEGNRVMGGTSGAAIGALLAYIMSQRSASETKPTGGVVGAAGGAGKHLATHLPQGLAAGYVGTRGLGTFVGDNSLASQLRNIDDPRFFEQKRSKLDTLDFNARGRFENQLEEARNLQKEGKKLRAARVASKAERGLNKPWHKVLVGSGWRPEETARNIGSVAGNTAKNLKTLVTKIPGM